MQYIFVGCSRSTCVRRRSDELDVSTVSCKRWRGGGNVGALSQLRCRNRILVHPQHGSEWQQLGSCFRTRLCSWRAHSDQRAGDASGRMRHILVAEWLDGLPAGAFSSSEHEACFEPSQRAGSLSSRLVACFDSSQLADIDSELWLELVAFFEPSQPAHILEPAKVVAFLELCEFLAFFELRCSRRVFVHRDHCSECCDCYRARLRSWRVHGDQRA